MAAFNPMAGFQIDPWSGANIASQSNGITSNPVMEFGYGVSNPVAMPGSGMVGATSPSWFENMVGYKKTDGTAVNGWGGAALGLMQGLGSAYMGMKQYGLMKDQLQFSKDAFNKNYAAQAKMTNASLLDRQRARVASNPGAYQSVGDYMAQNGIVV